VDEFMDEVSGNYSYVRSAEPLFAPLTLCRPSGHPHTSGMKLDVTFKKLALGPVAPTLFEFSIGAQWVVPNYCITRHGRNFWERLAADLSTVGLAQMERLWGYIF
jgi:hypothetical protein